MWSSFLRRIGYGIFWIWVISLLAFYLSKQVPGDPIEDYLTYEQRAVNVTTTPAEDRRLYQQVAGQRQLDLPFFYFSIGNGLYPDTLNRILPEADQVHVTHGHAIGYVQQTVFRQRPNGFPVSRKFVERFFLEEIF